MINRDRPTADREPDKLSWTKKGSKATFWGHSDLRESSTNNTISHNEREKKERKVLGHSTILIEPP